MKAKKQRHFAVRDSSFDIRYSDGFSLIELLLVICLMAVIAGLVLPSTDPSIHDQLRSAARILATDLAYGRSLAVTHDSNYRITFDAAENRYLLEHSGSNPALDTLPEGPFASPDDPPDQHIVDLDELPRIGATVHVLGAAGVSNFLQPVGDVTFGPLGETEREEETVIWLSIGSGSEMRYISVLVNPVTGLATVEPFNWDRRLPPPWLISN